MFKSIAFFILMFFIIAVSINAQQTINSAGGEAKSNNGTISYSIGQTFNITETGSNGNSIAEGVQQPYEISEITGITEANGINININTYPNPADNYLILKVENYEISNLKYQIYDIAGKLLQTLIPTGTETNINISDFVPGNYFVKILDKKQIIKVFKIIKN